MWLEQKGVLLNDIIFIFVSASRSYMYFTPNKPSYTWDCLKVEHHEQIQNQDSE
jgi:hypothetical protein